LGHFKPGPVLKEKAREPEALLPFNLISGVTLDFVKFSFQLFFGLSMIRIRNTAIYRTDRSALGFIKIANTFSTFVRVDLISFITSRDRLIRAFWFAGTAVDTFFCDFIGHLFLLLFSE